MEDIDIFIRDIWISKVKNKFKEIDCNIYPIPNDWHRMNDHYTLNECSFLTKLRHCTDIFCIDDIIYDGV